MWVAINNVYIFILFPLQVWWDPFCPLIDHLLRWEMAIIRNSLDMFWFPIIFILVLVGTEYACLCCLLVGLWHLHHFFYCYFASVLLMARSQEVLLICINLCNIPLSDSLGIICRANDKLLAENYLSDMVLTENLHTGSKDLNGGDYGRPDKQKLDLPSTLV